MNNKLVEIIGWLGMAAIIFAYALLNFNVITQGMLMYPLLNLFGAIAIVYHSFKKKDYQPGLLNIIWSLIAIFAIIKLLLI